MNVLLPSSKPPLYPQTSIQQFVILDTNTNMIPLQYIMIYIHFDITGKYDCSQRQELFTSMFELTGKLSNMYSEYYLDF